MYFWYIYEIIYSFSIAYYSTCVYYFLSSARTRPIYTYLVISDTCILVSFYNVIQHVAVSSCIRLQNNWTNQYKVRNRKLIGQTSGVSVGYHLGLIYMAIHDPYTFNMHLFASEKHQTMKSTRCTYCVPSLNSEVRFPLSVRAISGLLELLFSFPVAAPLSARQVINCYFIFGTRYHEGTKLIASLVTSVWRNIVLLSCRRASCFPCILYWFHS